MEREPTADTASNALGFTLVELLAVLGILAVLILVTPHPSLSSGIRLRTAMHDLATNLRLLRDAASRTGTLAGLRSTGNSYLLIPSGRLQPLPKDFELRTIPGVSALVGGTTNIILFYPDGSSSGGSITLRHGHSEIHLVIRWLDGQVRFLD